MVEIPIYQKLNLTIEEAAAYSNIGINRLYELIKRPDSSSFILYVGKKRLFKRKPFEEYLMKQVEV